MLVNEGCGFPRNKPTVFSASELEQKEDEDEKRRIRERGHEPISKLPRCEGRIQFKVGNSQSFVQYVARAIT
jgi:hypothetical protein